MSYLFERYPGARKLSAAFNTIIVEFPSNTNMTDIGKRAYFQAVKSFTEILILADPSANFTTMLNIPVLLSEISENDLADGNDVFLNTISLIVEVMISQVSRGESTAAIACLPPLIFTIGMFAQSTVRGCITSQKITGKIVKLIVLLLSDFPESFEVLTMIRVKELDPLITALDVILKSYYMESKDLGVNHALTIIYAIMNNDILKVRMVDRGILLALVDIQYLPKLCSFSCKLLRKINFKWIGCLANAAENSAIRYRLKVAAFKPFEEVPGLDAGVINAVSMSGVIPMM
jgi:hypothetical protein